MVNWKALFVAYFFIFLYFIVNVFALYRLDLRLEGVENFAFWSAFMVFSFFSTRIFNVIEN